MTQFSVISRGSLCLFLHDKERSPNSAEIPQVFWVSSHWMQIKQTHPTTHGIKSYGESPLMLKELFLQKLWIRPQISTGNCSIFSDGKLNIPLYKEYLKWGCCFHEYVYFKFTVNALYHGLLLTPSCNISLAAKIENGWPSWFIEELVIWSNTVESGSSSSALASLVSWK